jgi:hypothetical protein
LLRGGFEKLNETVTTGPERGRALAEKEAPKTGIALVIVAGERYAAVVESRGYNVLTKEGLEMDKQVMELIKTLK